MNISVPAFRTTHPRKAKVQVAAAEELASRVADDGTPGTIPLSIPVRIALFELWQETLDHLVERRSTRPGAGDRRWSLLVPTHESTSQGVTYQRDDPHCGRGFP